MERNQAAEQIKAELAQMFRDAKMLAPEMVTEEEGREIVARFAEVNLQMWLLSRHGYYFVTTPKNAHKLSLVCTLVA